MLAWELPLRRTTQVVRSGLTPAVAGEALNAGPVFAAPFHAPGDPAGVAYSYAGSHNPTWTALEGAIAALEGPQARALVFASGMAALAAVFGAVLRPGNAVVLDEEGYSGARGLLGGYFRELGVEVRAVPSARQGDPEVLAGARLLWIETPSNPRLAISDIAELSGAAHDAGALVAVDNTTATAFGQSPLALGADLSVASDSKALTGHSDLLLGHVATRDGELFRRLERYRGMHGAALGPMEAWLALRSLPTLPLRLERMCANALGIAEFLADKGEVREVLYPGLPGHPSHAIAARQMTHFGPVVSFNLPDQAAAEAFLSRAELVTEATSFGGVVTTAERRARWGNDRVDPGFIRLSAGCEDLGDLLADIRQALEPR